MSGARWIDAVSCKTAKKMKCKCKWCLLDEFMLRMKEKEKETEVNLRSEQSFPLKPRSQWHSPSMQRPCPEQPGT